LETREAFRDLLGELRELAVQSGQYPFLKALGKPIEDIQELIGKDYTFFLEGLPAQEDSLLDDKENILDPIRRFMHGANKDIYDEAARFLQEQRANFDAIGDGKPDQLRAILAAEDCYRGNQMREAKNMVDALKGDIEKQLQLEKAGALGRIQQLQTQLGNMANFDELTQEQKSELDQSFNAVEYQIKEQTLIPVIRDKVGRYETADYNRLLEKISEWRGESGGEFISQRELDLEYDKAFLADESDVENYLQALKKSLLKAIKAKKRIRV